MKQGVPRLSLADIRSETGIPAGFLPLSDASASGIAFLLRAEKPPAARAPQKGCNPAISNS